MSVMYKLFDKPRDVGEFVDKAIRNRESHVEITLGERETDLGAGASFHHYKLSLKTGTCNLRVDGASSLSVFGNRHENEVRNIIAEHNALVQAIKVGQYMEEQGLRVSIQGKPPAEILGELDRYRQRAESKSKEYGLDLNEEGAPHLWHLN